MKEYEITEGIQPGANPEAMPNFGDMIKYGAIIMEIVNTLKSLTSLAAGAVVPLQTIKLRLGGNEWEWQLGTITRKK